MYFDNPVASCPGMRLPWALQNRKRDKKRNTIMRKETWEHFRLMEGVPMTRSIPHLHNVQSVI